LVDDSTAVPAGQVIAASAVGQPAWVQLPVTGATGLPVPLTTLLHIWRMLEG
jgi:hypothetical protein